MKWSNASLLLLALVVTVWLWPVAVFGRRPVGGDISAVDLPAMTYYHQALSLGRIPQWNEQVGFGRPMHAEGQIGTLYPPNLLLYRCFGPHDAYTAAMVLHLVFASWFAYACARGFGLSPASSFLAAVVYAGQGFFVGTLGQSWSYQTGCWLPLAVFCAWRWLEFGEERWLFGLILVWAVQLLAGHFQLAFYTLVTLLALAALSLFGQAWWRRACRGGLMCGALVVAMLLAAVQLLPTAEYLRLADGRGRGMEFLASFSLPPWQLLNYIAPTLFQRHPLWKEALWIPNHTTRDVCLTYIGLIPLALAVWALGRTRRQRVTWIFVILWIGSVILSWGPRLPVLNWLVQLPGFGWFAAPAHWSVVSGLFLALLAGKGLEHCGQTGFPRFLRFYVVALAGILAVSVVVLFGVRNSEPFDRELTGGQLFNWELLEYGYSSAELTTRRIRVATELPRMIFDELWPPLLHLVVLLGATWTVVFRGARTQLLTLLLVVWSVVDLGITHHVCRRVEWEPRGNAPQQSRVLASILPQAPHRVAGTLGNLPGLVGVASLGRPPFGDMGTYWKMDARVFGQCAATVPPLGRWADLALMLGYRAGGLGEDELEFCRLSDIRTIILESNALISLPGEPFVHVDDVADDWLRRHTVGANSRNPSAREWSIWELGADTNTARAWLFPLGDPLEAGSDPRLFVRPPPRRRGMLDRAVPLYNLVDRGESVEVRGSTDGPAVLLLSDQYYAGWNAVLTQSGSSQVVPIQSAFGSWRAVMVPQAGDFQIRFQFQPESFRIGLRISLMMGVLCLVGFAATLMVRRLERTPSNAGSSERRFTESAG